MSREHYVIKKMRYPNVNGLVELSRRTGTTLQDLNDAFSADRLIRIDGNSCLHETCNRALENRNLFYNYRHVIKEAIANSFRMCNENETLRMEKHACYNLTLRGKTYLTRQSLETERRFSGNAEEIIFAESGENCDVSLSDQEKAISLLKKNIMLLQKRF